MRPGLGPRLAAFDILQAVDHGLLFDEARDRFVEAVTGPDRTLAHQIAAGVLRNRTLIDSLIAPSVSRPWKSVDPALKNALRVGAFQIAWLDRVPRHSAVDTAVELAKLRCGKKTSGLVNAVLRRLPGGIPGEGPPQTTSDLAVRFSHPEWLVERWADRFGYERTTDLLIRNNSVPAITIVPARITAGELADIFEAAGIRTRASAFGHGLSVAHARVTELPGYADGLFFVQDPAQSKLIKFANIDSEIGPVWDACAAPGGKTALLGCSGKRVIGSDSLLERVRRTSSSMRRLRIDAPLVTADAGRPPFARDAFGAVLVDAPCSATGTFRKHPDARWRVSPETIETAVRTQEKILRGVADSVRPGGLLVYMTCSVEREENEDQIDSFLSMDPRFERSCADLSIFPTDYGTDGAFGARLTRKE